MNKIGIIAKREFLSRVKKKTFLLTTILLPLFVFGIYGVIIFFATKGSETFRVAVADKGNIFTNQITNNDKEVNFTFLNNESEEGLRKRINNKEYDGYLYIPAGTGLNSKDTLKVVSNKKPGISSINSVEEKINNALEEKKLLSYNLTASQLDSLQKSTHVKFVSFKGEEESKIKATFVSIIGFVFGFLIYMTLFIYGTMVMRGVMEEKVNRIAEVIVSSVKPYQLMMGKILGIGSVGLVQFLIWIVLAFGLRLVLFLIFPDAAQQVQPGMAQAAEAAQANGGIAEALKGLGQINFGLIIGCFIFYFLGGYMLYSSLFAAIGSAVNEDPQDAQSLTFPVTMPIVFAMVIMIKTVSAPNSGLAVFGSMFPLTSPIVMMARVANGVPDGVTVTQLIISMLLLIAGFLGTTWLAAKIYRTGILMYGKKITWKEMIKWVRR